jgi:hypothetical protein
MELINVRIIIGQQPFCNFQAMILLKPRLGSRVHFPNIEAQMEKLSRNDRRGGSKVHICHAALVHEG